MDTDTERPGKLNPITGDTAETHIKFIKKNLTSSIPPNAKDQRRCTSNIDTVFCLYSR